MGQDEQPCQDETCDGAAPWESKTLWVSLIVAVAPLFPPAQAFIVANPTAVAGAVGAVFAALRLWSGRKGASNAGKKIVLPTLNVPKK
jgi:hypothetical protein